VIGRVAYSHLFQPFDGEKPVWAINTQGIYTTHEYSWVVWIEYE
jgi:hypothetical protein